VTRRRNLPQGVCGSPERKIIWKRLELRDASIVSRIGASTTICSHIETEESLYIDGSVSGEMTMLKTAVLPLVFMPA
jgi:cytoskeletal protein CcmA (bactofilin family)